MHAIEIWEARYGYTDIVLQSKLARRNGEDSRDFATYTIPEAAIILGIPPRTVQQWFAGDIPVLTATAHIGGFPLLSFRDALDVYALFLLRSRHRLSMQEIKKAIRSMLKHTQARHAISEHIGVFRDHLILERPKRGKRERQIVDLTSGDGDQLAIPDIVDVFSNRVLKSADGKLTAIFPWRFWERDNESTPVKIDPEVMSGRLVITGTRIPVRMIADRIRRGQTATYIADDYRIPVAYIEKALKHLDKKAA